MPSDLWQETQDVIRTSLDEHAYRSWFEPTRFHSYNDGALTVSVPNEFYAKWLQTHYKDVIGGALEQIDPDCDDVVFLPSNDDGSMQKLSDGDTNSQFKHAKVERIVSSRSDTDSLEPQRMISGLNPKYTFDKFVVGPSNRFAHAAALAVAESPGRAYNPLFLYGGVGLGKTHLMKAIGNEMLRRDPSLRNVVYVSSEVFTNELIDAIMNKSTQAFRNKYRNVDVLLIDDIHFIAGKDSTQEEFFHTFNTLYDSHSQIVLSSDCPPKDIPLLEERMISRFQWGLVTDIQAPDVETRIAILQQKAVQQNLTDVSREALHAIASLVVSNIRELEGALIRVRAYASLMDKPITAELVEEALKDMVGSVHGPDVTTEIIQQAVADHYGLRVADLTGKNKQRSVAFPRQVAMYLCRHILPGAALKEIGQAMGGRDHTTVIHACKRIEEEMTKNPALSGIIDHLINKIRQS